VRRFPAFLLNFALWHARECGLAEVTVEIRLRWLLELAEAGAGFVQVFVFFGEAES
jgi:hypothetical protein